MLVTDPRVDMVSFTGSTATGRHIMAAASESVPLANLGFKNIRSLEPGTLVVANRDGVRVDVALDGDRPDLVEGGHDLVGTSTQGQSGQLHAAPTVRSAPC